MPWLEPPGDYQVKAGDKIRLQIRTGIFGPPVWLVEDTLALSTWEFFWGVVEGNDLILEVEKRPGIEGAPEIIEAGAVPGYVIAILAAAGLGLVGLLLVKDFRVWVGEGGIGFETSTSIPGFVVVAAGLGVGVWFLSRRA